jgi:hypothetical protein
LDDSDGIDYGSDDVGKAQLTLGGVDDSYTAEHGTIHYTI